MSVIRRCDNCSTETTPPNMFNSEPDDWYCLFQPGDEQGLNFCSEGCVMNYFAAKRMIDEVTE